MRKTSGLPNTAPLGAGPIRSVPGGVFSFRRDGDQARQKSRAAMLFRKTRPRFSFAGLDPIEWKKHTSGRRLREGGTSAGSQLRVSTADFLVQTQTKRLSRTDEEEATLLRGRHGNFRGNEPKRTKHLHDVLFRQSRHAYLSGGVDLAGGERTDHGEPSGPRATLAAWSRLFLRRSRPSIRKDNELARNFWTQRYFGRVSSDCTWWYFPTREERRPRATK